MSETDTIKEVRHVIDPFTGDKYISFLIGKDYANDVIKQYYPYTMYELVPFKDYSDLKLEKYPKRKNITNILRGTVFKDVPDKLNDIEYSKFEHMNNLRRLKNIKHKLDDMGQEVITAYPNMNNAYIFDHNNRTYYLDYKPLLCITLKYDPDFSLYDPDSLKLAKYDPVSFKLLNYKYKNMQSEAVSVLERATGL